MSHVATSQADLTTSECENKVFKDSRTEPEEGAHRNGGESVLDKRHRTCKGPEAGVERHSRSKALRKASTVSGRQGKG